MEHRELPKSRYDPERNKSSGKAGRRDWDQNPRSTRDNRAQKSPGEWASLANSELLQPGPSIDLSPIANDDLHLWLVIAFCRKLPPGIRNMQKSKGTSTYWTKCRGPAAAELITALQAAGIKGTIKKADRLLKKHTPAHGESAKRGAAKQANTKQVRVRDFEITTAERAKRVLGIALKKP